MAKDSLGKNMRDWLCETIRNFVNESPENSLKNAENDKAWGEPLIGFSRGDDPLYEKYKEVVGSFHWTPEEIFRLTFPGMEPTSDQLTVISWILPHAEITKSDNCQETSYPSERWARARFFGEKLNISLRKQVVTILKESDVAAVAPMLSPDWGRRKSERYVFASTWSERHAAYASGLGTFGICDGLITAKGKAMRCGSVVALTQIPPTDRPYQDHHAYCLFYANGTCLECAKRCPAGAISEAGHDKKKCSSYMHPAIDQYVESRWGFKGYGCGLCQTGVPCESRNPTSPVRPVESGKA